jgi:hydrogenase maturation protease
VIGIGNPDRGDDAAGRAVARLLAEMHLEGADIVERKGEVTELMAAMTEASTVYLVDASLTGAAPGTVTRFDVGQNPLPQEAFSASTHGLGLAQAVELARTLGQLPARCIVYAIDGAGFEIGSPLSAPVQEAVTVVAGCLRQEIAALATDANHA